MNGKLLTILKSGGAIVLAGILAFIIWQVIQGYQTTINNHLEHNTDAWVETKEVLIGVKGAVEANTKQMERIEQLIDLKL